MDVVTYARWYNALTGPAKPAEELEVLLFCNSTMGMGTHVFSYVMRHDYGFAPNPFGGFLTLVTCKPQIRRAARIQDYVIGTGSAATVGTTKLVYAGQVSRIVAIEDYGRSPDYAIKRPSSSGDRWKRHGDNIYALVDGKWKQRSNPYHDIDRMDHDLGGVNVLACDHFWYFGENAVEIPPRLLAVVKKGSGHKRIKDATLVTRFVNWLDSLPGGILASATECLDRGSPLSRADRHCAISRRH